MCTVARLHARPNWTIPFSHREHRNQVRDEKAVYDQIVSIFCQRHLFHSAFEPQNITERWLSSTPSSSFCLSLLTEPPPPPSQPSSQYSFSLLTNDSFILQFSITETFNLSKTKIVLEICQT